MCETLLLPKSILLCSSPALPVPWSQSPLPPNFLQLPFLVLGIWWRSLLLLSSFPVLYLLKAESLLSLSLLRLTLSSADSYP